MATNLPTDPSRTVTTILGPAGTYEIVPHRPNCSRNRTIGRGRFTGTTRTDPHDALSALRDEFYEELLAEL